MKKYLLSIFIILMLVLAGTSVDARDTVRDQNLLENAGFGISSAHIAYIIPTGVTKFLSGTSPFIVDKWRRWGSPTIELVGVTDIHGQAGATNVITATKGALYSLLLTEAGTTDNTSGIAWPGHQYPAATDLEGGVSPPELRGKGWHYKQFAGKRVAFTADMLAPMAGTTSFVRLYVYYANDGVGVSTYSPYVTASNTWQSPEVTADIPAGITEFEVGVVTYETRLSGASVYICNPTLVFGRYIGEIRPKKYKEIIWLDFKTGVSFQRLNVGVTAETLWDIGSGATTINLQAASLGTLPDNITAVHATISLAAGVTGTGAVAVRGKTGTGVKLYPPALSDGVGDGGTRTWSGWIPVDDDGDITLTKTTDTKSGTSIFIMINAVQLR